MIRKRILLIMIAIFVCAFILSCTDKKNAGKTDRWISYGTSNSSGQKYYDKQTMTNVGPKVIRVSDKLELTKDAIDKIIEKRKESNLSIDGWDKLQSVVILRELDCTNKSTKNIRIEDYNDKGKILYESDYQNPWAEPIQPGSMFESLLNEVCPK